jgi:hypothetical protein
MINNLQQRIVTLRNEIQSQKTFSGLTYSRLLLPENAPTQTYSGRASLTGSGSTPVAEVRFRFTRTDGLTDTPAINFAFSSTISPTYVDFVRSKGFTISGNELAFFDQWTTAGFTREVGDGFVDFIVAIQPDTREAFFSLDYLDFSITCQAITNVYGTLTVERII